MIRPGPTHSNWENYLKNPIKYTVCLRNFPLWTRAEAWGQQGKGSLAVPEIGVSSVRTCYRQIASQGLL